MAREPEGAVKDDEEKGNDDDACHEIPRIRSHQSKERPLSRCVTKEHVVRVQYDVRQDDDAGVEIGNE
jgi:hypothetical protein